MAIYLNERKCKFPGCENVYRPDEISRSYCSLTHEVACIQCEAVFETVSGPPSRRKTECKKCIYEKANVKRKETLLELYGVENQFQRKEIKDKLKEKWDESYGGHPMKDKVVKAKVKATNEERYGGSAPAHSDAVKEKIRQTNLERYGVEWSTQADSMIEKARNTNLERYGAETPFGSKEIQEKIQQTNLERYGVKNPFQSEDIKKRIKEKMNTDHGVSFPLQVPKFKAKAIATNNERFSSDWPFGNKKVNEKAHQTMLERYGVEHALLVPEFRSKAAASYAETVKSGGGKSSRISKLNRHWGKLLSEEFGVTYSFEEPFGQFSADLSFAEGKVLVDINPTVTHNSFRSLKCLMDQCDLPCSAHKHTERNYHVSRAQTAMDFGVKLVQIYDWDSKNSVIRLLAGHLEKGWKRHSARKLKLREVPQRIANEFLKENHVQAGLKGQEVCLGLFDDELLLSVATFGKARFKAKYQWEFLRYAVKRGHVIHGAAGRLWEYFLNSQEPESVISYIDFNHTTRRENFLLNLGYTETDEIAPVLHWSKGDRVIRETSLLALGADRLLKTNYGPREESGLDNHGIMIAEGWLPIYTAGNRNFVWKR